MSLHDFLSNLGLNPNFIIAGTAGGFLRALSRKQFKLREVFISPICGALAAAYLTTPIMHYAHHFNFPVPSGPESVAVHNATAFMVGVIAMWISDIVFGVIARKLKVKEE
ncbi:hypothetical protein [Brucella pseudogrignonensis]|uniref:Biotin transporter BioY n=1 Tax=Brucella pseudogrignonensis TaxID=419475 RepID=A0ABU1M5H8_9HYPH|nr:hypothetical protein [Brucella pseudogrignonensis]MDR6431320.1 biotin transporter BioY [Brucella pseudogrignonensis]